MFFVWNRDVYFEGRIKIKLFVENVKSPIWDSSCFGVANIAINCRLIPNVYSYQL